MFGKNQSPIIINDHDHSYVYTYYILFLYSFISYFIYHINRIKYRIYIYMITCTNCLCAYIYMYIYIYIFFYSIPLFLFFLIFREASLNEKRHLGEVTGAEVPWCAVWPWRVAEETDHAWRSITSHQPWLIVYNSV